jgi:hypothetical protein
MDVEADGGLEHVHCVGDATPYHRWAPDSRDTVGVPVVSLQEFSRLIRQARLACVKAVEVTWCAKSRSIGMDVLLRR